MNRERAAWLLSFFVLVVAAFRNPTAAQRDNDYRFVRTLVDIHRQVTSSYVDKVDEAKLERAAIDGMLRQLDPYTVYIPPALREDYDRFLEGNFKGVGIELYPQIGNGPVQVATPIEGSPAFRAGVHAGDIIIKINGESIEGQPLEEVIKKLAGELGSEVRMTVRRLDGEELELKMKREEVTPPSVLGYRRKANNSWDYFVSNDPKIAYIRIRQFTPTTIDTLRPALQDLLRNGMKGLILDLRGNPGGPLDQAIQTVNLFVSEGVIVSTKGRNAPENIERATPAATLAWFPMIVLIDDLSASAAEIVAGSLKDNKRAVVLGERSFGKGSVQTVIPLEGNNGELKMTIAHYYLPSGRLVHRMKGATDWGVEPQISVPMSREAKHRAAEDRVEREAMQAPNSRPSTRPTTQGTDIQLQRAVDSMVLMSLLENHPPQKPARPAATTRPSATTAP